MAPHTPRALFRSAPQEIRGAAAEQQETAEGERVAGNDPLQARFGHMQLAADGRNATLTIARSATVMKNETASTANARQRWT
jgi:hypothetical protein